MSRESRDNALAILVFLAVLGLLVWMLAATYRPIPRGQRGGDGCPHFICL